jgi:hypothetical protein
MFTSFLEVPNDYSAEAQRYCAALTMFLGMKGNKDFVAPADAFNSVKEQAAQTQG